MLGDNVQKYSSTTVEGGGGYINTVNGVTYGQNAAVTSSVQHHVEQDIWVKDLQSGHEFQIKLKGEAFPVRQGHILRIVFDGDTKQWERLFNESTGQMGYGQGFMNSTTISKYRELRNKAYLYAIGLSVPLVNLIVGVSAMIALLFAPGTYCGTRIPKARRSIALAFLYGCALVGLSTFGLVIFGSESRKWSDFSKFICVVSYVWCLREFVRHYQKPWTTVCEIIDQRSEYLDSLVMNP